MESKDPAPPKVTPRGSTTLVKDKLVAASIQQPSTTNESSALSETPPTIPDTSPSIVPQINTEEQLQPTEFVNLPDFEIKKEPEDPEPDQISSNQILSEPDQMMILSKPDQMMILSEPDIDIKEEEDNDRVELVVYYDSGDKSMESESEQEMSDDSDGDIVLPLQVVDVDRCRLCMSTTNNLMDIFTSRKLLKPSLLILKYLNIEVKKDDGLTQLICDKCLDCLLKVNNLAAFAEKAQQTLREQSKGKENHITTKNRGANEETRVARSRTSSALIRNSEASNQLRTPEASNQLETPEVSKQLRNPEASNQLRNPEASTQLKNPEASNQHRNPEASSQLRNPEASNRMGRPEKISPVKQWRPNTSSSFFRSFFSKSAPSKSHQHFQPKPYNNLKNWPISSKSASTGICYKTLYNQTVKNSKSNSEDNRPKEKPLTVDGVLLDPTRTKLPFLCEFCDEPMTIVPDTKRHYYMTHFKYLCDVCFIHYDNISLLNQHRADSHTVKCEICDIQVSSGFDLMTHMRTSHKDVDRALAGLKHVTDFKMKNLTRKEREQFKREVLKKKQKIIADSEFARKQEAEIKEAFERRKRQRLNDSTDINEAGSEVSNADSLKTVNAVDDTDSDTSNQFDPEAEKHEVVTFDCDVCVLSFDSEQLLREHCLHEHSNVLNYLNK